VLYFADGRWWGWHDKGVDRPALGLTAADVQDRFRSFAGVKVSIEGNEAHLVKDPEIPRLRDVSMGNTEAVFSSEPDGLATGRNSGFQAINLAWLAGAAQILLLGYDMKTASDRPHWFGDHPIPTHPYTIESFRAGYEKLARRMPPGLDIINCSRDTALTCFPRATLESLLPDPAAAALPA